MDGWRYVRNHVLCCAYVCKLDSFCVCFSQYSFLHFLLCVLPTQAVEKDGSSSLEDLAEFEEILLSPISAAASSKTTGAGQAGGDEGTDGVKDSTSVLLEGEHINANDIILMKKKIQDLEEISNCREEKISKVRYMPSQTWN